MQYLKRRRVDPCVGQPLLIHDLYCLTTHGMITQKKTRIISVRNEDTEYLQYVSIETKIPSVRAMHSKKLHTYVRPEQS